MKIALVNIEPKIVNSAYMQISAYHKQRGDSVEWWISDKNYDRIYCSSLFDFTDKSSVPGVAICGGSGYNLEKKLPKQIEKCEYDYSLYPDCEYSIVWFSRGCIRKCPYCAVPRKEGDICSVNPLNLNPNGEYIRVQDNNFFASPSWPKAIECLLNWNQPVEFNGGLDARTLRRKECEAVNRLKRRKQIKLAWDNPREKMDKHINRVIKYIRPYKLMCYVLIGYWSTPEQDMMRVMKLHEMKVDPFVMPYDKHDEYQRRFARWVNHKAIFKSVAWKDYK